MEEKKEKKKEVKTKDYTGLFMVCMICSPIILVVLLILLAFIIIISPVMVLGFFFHLFFDFLNKSQTKKLNFEYDLEILKLKK